MKILVYHTRLSYVSEVDFKSVENDKIEITTAGVPPCTLDWELFTKFINNAEDISKYDLIETGYINLNNIVCSHNLPVKISYSNQPVILEDRKKYIVFKYIDYETSELFLPYYTFGEFVDDIPTITPLNSENILLLESSNFYTRLLLEDSNFKITQKLYSRTRLPSKIENSSSFSIVYSDIDRCSTPVLLAGKAGSGKSSFLRFYRDRKEGSVALLSPTGVSALNIFGETIHSFFKLPLKVLAPNSFDLVKKPKYKNLAVLLIDEISMVRADVLDAVDIILRHNKNSSLPFGGTKVVFTGDIAQLPPVVENDLNLKEYFNAHYASEWFFDSRVLNEKYEVHELTQSYRQNDDKYISILNRIRYATQTADDIEHLNQMCYYQKDPIRDIITLTPTNQSAQRINQIMLDQIQSKEFCFEAATSGVYSSETDNPPTDYVLRLKVGAQIIMLKNDINNRWVNGSIGKITDLNYNKVIVEVNGYECILCKSIWTKYKYEYDKNTDKLIQTIIGEFEQYPIKPSWAITIHKSQGLTIDRIKLDVGNGMFAAGQLYVALSRCKKMDDIWFTKPITERDIIVDPRIVKFAHKYGI